MTFQLFGFDFYLQDKLFGFWLFGIHNQEEPRNLFCIYWNDGELLIDLFWVRILSIFPSIYFTKD